MTVPSVRGSVISAVETELLAMAEEGGRSRADLLAEIGSELATLLEADVDPTGWQPLGEREALVRSLATLAGPTPYGALREAGRRISQQLVRGDYELNEANRYAWGSWLGSALVQLAPAMINVGRWEFEVVRPLNEGIVYAREVAELDDSVQAVCEGVIVALVGRVLKKDVELVVARPTPDTIEFRFRAKGEDDRPSSVG